MKSKDKKNEVPTNFPDIETVEGLKLYLDDMASRLKNSPYLYHYTTVSNVIKMIQGKMASLVVGATFSSVALCAKIKKALGCGVCMHSHGKKE